MKGVVKGFLSGVLVTCALLMIFFGAVGLYETGKTKGNTRTVYVAANDSFSTTAGECTPNSAGINISLDKKGECVLVSKPNETNAVMECVLI